MHASGVGATVQQRTGMASRLDCVEVAPGDGQSEIIPGDKGKMGSLDRGLKNVFPQPVRLGLRL